MNGIFGKDWFWTILKRRGRKRNSAHINKNRGILWKIETENYLSSNLK
jgi:hypothetical protein